MEILFIPFPFSSLLVVVYFYIRVKQNKVDMKEVKIYLSSRCIISEGKGSYGCLISCEDHIFSIRHTLSQTSMPRMMMRAAIDSIFKVIEVFGESEIEIYSNQHVLIESMIKKRVDSKAANFDLYLKFLKVSRDLNVCSKTIDEGCNEMFRVVSELSGDALRMSTHDIDERESGFSESLPLF